MQWEPSSSGDLHTGIETEVIADGDRSASDISTCDPSVDQKAIVEDEACSPIYKGSCGKFMLDSRKSSSKEDQLVVGVLNSFRTLMKSKTSPDLEASSPISSEVTAAVQNGKREDARRELPLQVPIECVEPERDMTWTTREGSLEASKAIDETPPITKVCFELKDLERTAAAAEKQKAALEALTKELERNRQNFLEQRDIRCEALEAQNDARDATVERLQDETKRELESVRLEQELLQKDLLQSREEVAWMRSKFEELEAEMQKVQQPRPRKKDRAAKESLREEAKGASTRGATPRGSSSRTKANKDAAKTSISHLTSSWFACCRGDAIHVAAKQQTLH
mmetsp:Transcript_81178/g.225943  ORF Transcript_81178/g.225943 Transcript_81178/m.225943 type:complete len:339 (+) Transcript_81178:69-1085(+)